MALDNVFEQQKIHRGECLTRILECTSSKKLIVAGPGTGKTFTYKQLLKTKEGGNNLTMTFTRNLVDDMQLELCDQSEVKTFHAYCKNILHEKDGRVHLFPFLTEIISTDAQLLGLDLSDFDDKFQLLEEESKEVSFYLSRGDYYSSVSFNDSVYRFYKHLKADPSIISTFDQIVIDEFQDFNPLEVAFIAELSKKGHILIVGDDDQAVYHGEGARHQSIYAPFIMIQNTKSMYYLIAADVQKLSLIQ